jgi:hypothetical protein
MRIRLPFVVAAIFSLALPVFASTVRPMAPAHRHHHASVRPATDSRCGKVAGHASHTVLAAPASISCRASAPASLARASATIRAQSRPANLATQQVHTHASIAPLARIHFVPPLRGSLQSLVRQNQRNDAEGLVRIEDDAQLDQLETARDIVPLPASFSLRVNPDLPANRRYCRPWTSHFLADLARSHYMRFHRALQVNSAVRTVDFQRSLIAINGNAAPAEGDIASPHLTGAAVDIGKKGLTLSEISWMRAWLLPLQTAGKIDVEEEFYQSCFHITVYRGYAPPTLTRPAPPRLIAHHRHSTTTLLATGVH